MPSPDDKLTPPAAKRRPSRILAVVRGTFAVITLLGIAGAGVGGVVGYTLYQSYTADLPSLDGLRTYQPRVMSRIYAGDDALVAELANERRIFVPVAAIPEVVKRAFIAAEDKNFYQHKGVDPTAILRAALTDLQHIHAGRRPEGASTITQQVARNMLLGTNDLSFRRKAKEALLALRIEQTLSKPRILELYLNEIYLGQGSYGVAAAAQAYFNKSLSQVSIAQAASLASLPKSPTNYNLFRHPDEALARRNWVIDRMVETGAITRADADAAKAEALGPDAYRPPATVPGADWFADEVKRTLIERFGQDQAAEGGLVVHTSLEPRLQRLADTALRTGLLAYDHGHGGWRGPLGHLSGGGDLAATWIARLHAMDEPHGMLAVWRLAVVLEETGPQARGGAQARVGWLEETDDPDQPKPHYGILKLSELGWARHVSPDGTLGAAPRRMEDVAPVGSLVFVEPDAGDAPGVQHVALRQIPAVSGALVSLDPQTGRVLAMSGGWDGGNGQFNRATQAKRQPGSSFKPFVYLTAMTKGIAPSARFLDEPFVMGDWRPNNYEMTFGGPTPLHVALEQSLNLVTVRVAQHIGMDAVAKTAIAYHLVDAMPRVLPAALGAVETTVLREAGAYASIEQDGRIVTPSVIDSVQDRDGQVIWRAPGLAMAAGDPAQPPSLYDPRQSFADAASSYQVLKMLEGVVLNGTGVPVVRGMDPRPIAGKTGTSQDYNDAWFAGFTPDLVTVVWVGFDAPRTLGDEQTGAVVAGPIWRDFMQNALKGVPPHDFRQPEGVTVASWPCGTHSCVDAFKPDQTPGAGGVPGLAAEPGQQADNPQTADGSAPATPATPPRGAGTGVDSGVGGLY